MNPGDNLTEWLWRRLSDRIQQSRNVLSNERRFSCGEVVQHAAEAEEIGAMVDVVTGDLFGSHIAWGAKNRALLCQAFVGGHVAGQAKIKNLDAAGFGFDPDIVGFDVAMNQPFFMRRSQPHRDFFADAGDVFGM